MPVAQLCHLHKPDYRRSVNEVAPLGGGPPHNMGWTSHGYYTTSVESLDSLIDDLNKESFET